MECFAIEKTSTTQAVNRTQPGLLIINTLSNASFSSSRWKTRRGLRNNDLILSEILASFSIFLMIVPAHVNASKVGKVGQRGGHDHL